MANFQENFTDLPLNTDYDGQNTGTGWGGSSWIVTGSFGGGPMIPSRGTAPCGGNYIDGTYRNFERILPTINAGEVFTGSLKFNWHSSNHPAFHIFFDNFGIVYNLATGFIGFGNNPYPDTTINLNTGWNDIAWEINFATMQGRFIINGTSTPVVFIPSIPTKLKLDFIGYGNAATDMWLACVNGTTSSPSPTVVTLSATSVASTGATLNGTVNPNGSATNYAFEYGTTSGIYSSTTAPTAAGSGTSPVSASASISGLTPSTTYYYRVVAANGTGASNGNEMQFTTAAPSAPNTITDASSGADCDSVDLNGRVNTYGLAGTYQFEWGYVSGSYPNVTAIQNITSNSLTAVTATISPTPSTTVYYRLKATSSSGTDYGVQQSTSTTDCRPIVATDALLSSSCGAATLDGRINTGDIAGQYRFNWGYSSGVYTNNTTLSNITTNILTQVTALISPNPGVTVYYRLEGINAYGTSYGAEQTFMSADCNTPILNLSCIDPTNVRYNSVTLNGTIDPNGLSTNYFFQLGTTPGVYTITTATQTISIADDVTINVTGLTPSTTYYYRLVATNSDGTTTGTQCSFNTTVAPPPGQWLNPGSVIDCGGVTGCNNILSCNDKKCACSNGTHTMIVGDFPLSETETISVTNADIEIRGAVSNTSNPTTGRVRVFLFDDISDSTFLLLDENLTTDPQDFTNINASNFGGIFDDNNAFNNLKLKIEITDACVNCVRLRMRYLLTEEDCPEIPQPCCGLPGEFPVFTLAQNFEKDQDEIVVNDFRIKLENGTNINIETILQNTNCGGMVIINRGTRDRDDKYQEVIRYEDIFRVSDNQVRIKIKSGGQARGIQPFAPFASDPRFIQEHKKGDPIELYFGAAWQAEHVAFNCGESNEAPCYTTRLSYCGNLPAIAPQDNDYVLWSDIQDLLSGSLPPINCATTSSSGLVRLAAFNEVTNGVVPGAGVCPLVLTTQNTGAIFYLGHGVLTNVSQNSPSIQMHSAFTTAMCGVRGTFVPTQTNTGSMTLTVNGITKPLTKNSGLSMEANDIVPQRSVDFIYNCSSGSFEVISGLRTCCEDTEFTWGYRVVVGGGAGAAHTGLLTDRNDNQIPCAEIVDGVGIDYVSPSNSLGNDTLNINNCGPLEILTSKFDPLTNTSVLVKIKKDEMLSGRMYRLVKHQIGSTAYWFLENPEQQLECTSDYADYGGYHEGSGNNPITWDLASANHGTYQAFRHVIGTPTDISKYCDGGYKWVMDITASCVYSATDPQTSSRVSLELNVAASSTYRIFGEIDDLQDYQGGQVGGYTRNKTIVSFSREINQTTPTVITGILHLLTNGASAFNPNTYATNQGVGATSEGHPPYSISYSLRKVKK